MIRVSNCLEPDQDRRYVGPDLAPNNLQRLSTNRGQNLPLAWNELKAFLLWHDGLIQKLASCADPERGTGGIWILACTSSQIQLPDDKNEDLSDMALWVM